MKNYDVRAIDANTVATLRAKFDRLIPGGSELCIFCNYQPAYDYAVCGRCRGACDHITVGGYIRIANGDKQARSYCMKCGDNQGGLPRGSTILDFCFKDNTNPTPCERCNGTTGVELHHWAPRNTFGWQDAETWPQAWLCRDCHHEWHRRMDGYQWTRRSA